MQVRSVRSGQQASTPTPPLDGPNTSSLIATARMTCLQCQQLCNQGSPTPNIPSVDKSSVVVQHADGTRERYLLAPNMLNAFIKNLPKGDKFV